MSAQGLRRGIANALLIEAMLAVLIVWVVVLYNLHG